MAPQPRWTIPVNMRAQDKPVLDVALAIARSEGTEITSVFRAALSEFVKSKSSTQGRRMDEFLDGSDFKAFSCDSILTPGELKNWSESDLLRVSKSVRSRQQELDAELRRRGFFFKW
jgi:hypothetical protein